METHEKNTAQNNDRKKSDAKKGGAGGKGTGGQPGPTPDDVRDAFYVGLGLSGGSRRPGAWELPGFVPDENAEYSINVNPMVQDALQMFLKEEKQLALDVIQEYIASDGDIAEAIELLRSRKEIEGYLFVEEAIRFGLEHERDERELISRLLPEAHEVFEGQGFDEAFQNILSSLPDLKLDNPDAEEHVGLFMARAIYDDALEPSFLKQAVVDNEPAKVATTLAFSMTDNKAERARLPQIWGITDRTVDALRDEVDMILKEFLGAASEADTAKALFDLKCPSFMSQVVMQSLFLALETNSIESSQRILGLLKKLLDGGLIGEKDMRSGFELAVGALDDELPDLPRNSPELLKSYIDEAKKLSILMEPSVPFF